MRSTTKTGPRTPGLKKAREAAPVAMALPVAPSCTHCGSLSISESKYLEDDFARWTCADCGAQGIVGATGALLEAASA